MASQPRRGGVSLPARPVARSSDPQDGSITSKLANSQIVTRGKEAACDAFYVSKRLLLSTGKAAWIAGTTFLILVVPLIGEMDREQQLNELELNPTLPAPSLWSFNSFEASNYCRSVCVHW